VQVARTVDDFLRAPVGRCYAGRSFVYFYPDESFCGFRLGGEPTDADVDELVRVLDATRRPGTRPYLSLVDTAPLRRVEPSVFARMADYQAARMASYATLIRRQAMVRPSGMAGAVVAGFYALLDPPFPVRVFDSLDPALEWLGWPGAAAWREPFEALWRTVAEPPPVVTALRRYLESHLAAAPTLGACARALAVSRRTLQRRLREAGTGFGEELRAARVRAAQARLIEGDDKLEVVARAVGCRSPAHLAALFRKRVGEPPSAWRARQRAAAARAAEPSDR
jgi:AraC-like DNA-binding protein